MTHDVAGVEKPRDLRETSKEYDICVLNFIKDTRTTLLFDMFREESIKLDPNSSSNKEFNEKNIIQDSRVRHRINS